MTALNLVQLLYSKVSIVTINNRCIKTDNRKMSFLFLCSAGENL